MNGIRTHDLCVTGAKNENWGGLFSSSVMAVFTCIIMSTFNCYCWTAITMEFTYLSRVLRPLNVKGQPTHVRFHVALIAQLGEHCTGSAKIVGPNPVHSLKMFSGLFYSSVMVAFASIYIFCCIRIHPYLLL